MENLKSFSEVLEAFHSGRYAKFRRFGWNNKNAYITFEIPTEESGLTIPFLRMNVPGDPELKSAWVPSQSDMHVQDWLEVETQTGEER